MEGIKIRLILAGDRAFITNTHAIPISSIKFDNHVGSFKINGYWTAKVIAYIEKEGRLLIDVKGGGIGDVSFDYEQSLIFEKLNEVKTISFKNIGTGTLLSTVNYERAKSSPIPKDKSDMEALSTLVVDQSQNNLIEIQETISVKLDDVQIADGYAIVRHKFKEYSEIIELKIPNDFLVSGFDPIKNYFQNCLNLKKIEVSVDIEIDHGNIISRDIKSYDIERINPALIEEVHFSVLRDAYKRTRDVGESVVVTKEEFLQIALKDDGKINKQIDNKLLLEGLIKATNTKHQLQLEYLSSLNNTDLMKLRLVLKPFSFLFFIKSQAQYHFIWETLDGTDATYIWSYSIDRNNPDLCYILVKQELDKIYAFSRSAYLKEKEENFSKIIHDYKNEKAGFDNWRGDLERIIGNRLLWIQ